MGLFDFFRRQPPIREVAELADFIDEQAAFLVQKGIYDYSRARSGPHAKVLLGEAGIPGARSTSRAGAPFRSASPWSARWSRACCVRSRAATGAACSTR